MRKEKGGSRWEDLKTIQSLSIRKLTVRYEIHEYDCIVKVTGMSFTLHNNNKYIITFYVIINTGVCCSVSIKRNLSDRYSKISKERELAIIPVVGAWLHDLAVRRKTFSHMFFSSGHSVYWLTPIASLYALTVPDHL